MLTEDRKRVRSQLSHLNSRFIFTKKAMNISYDFMLCLASEFGARHNNAREATSSS